MLHFIIQTIAFQLFFLIIYDAFLKKETFFNWNRAYLLVTAILSVALPFIKIQSFKNVVPKEFVMAMPEVTIGNVQGINTNEAVEIVATETSKFQWSWELVFYIGASIALIIFMVKLLKIATLIYKNPKHWNQNLRIVILLKSNTAFSFFYYVFLGEQIKEEDKPTILKHEAVHVNQKHTLDLLFFELFRIVFWFNPLIYIYQSRIASLHEFIADAEAVKSQCKNEYYQDLLSQIFETENVSFINAFYKKSLIKKRIVMLSKAKSKQTQLIKYALLIPLVFGMLLYTSSYAQDKTQDEIAKKSTATQELTDKELQDKYYVEMLELYTAGNTDGIFKDSQDIKEKYLNTRNEYYRFQASMKVMFELNENSFVGDKIAFQNKLNRSYADYLEWKKTDEAKEIWENNTSDGELKLVVNDLNNLSSKETQRFNMKKELLDKDVFYTTLILTDIKGGETKLFYQPNEFSTANKHDDSKAVVLNKVDLEVGFAKVDEIPMLPTCKNAGTQNERRDCVASEISEHIKKNFNQTLAWNLGLTGTQRINVIFKIDTNGNVFGVRSRAPHPDLEAEAIRVIKTLPRFTPGKQNGKKVIVPYSLPIVFEVKESPNSITSYVQTTNSPSKEIIEKQDLTEVPFAVIGEVPVYPGCETIADQKEQRKCMANMISEFVQKKFNTDLAGKSGLTGRQRINVIFKIDTLGNVTGIRSRAAHPDLEKEAERVIGLLPKMQPGKHKGEKVIVPYSLPIVFEVAESSNKTKKDDKSNEEIKNEKSSAEIKSYANDGALPFAIVDKVPMFPKCESLSTNDEQRKCVSDEIIKIVQKNFNTNLSEKLGLKGKRQIMVVFQINEEGNLQNIKARGPHPELEAEAIRAIKLLPKFIPGEHEGKKVNVSYSLPIVYMVAN